jgi:hypothetical protein
MSFENLGQVGWLGVIAGAVVYFVVGAVWYTPALFGKPWMRSIGWEPAPDYKPNPAIYAAPLLTSLVASLALAMLAAATGSDTVSEGVVLGILTGGLIAGSVLLVTALFDPKKPEPWTWFGITAAYHLVGIVAASIAVSVLG